MTGPETGSGGGPPANSPDPGDPPAGLTLLEALLPILAMAALFVAGVATLGFSSELLIVVLTASGRPRLTWGPFAFQGPHSPR